jgi:hypothetical protein
MKALLPCRRAFFFPLTFFEELNFALSEKGIYFEKQSTFMNKEIAEESIQEIRAIMERSTRFISFSGISGVLAGIYALVAAGIILNHSQEMSDAGYSTMEMSRSSGALVEETDFIYKIGVITLTAALLTGIVFSLRKARITGQSLFGTAARRMALNLFIPLLLGGFFCLILIDKGLIGFLPGASLLFYGIALISASKYTHAEMWYLGLFEGILGLAASYQPEYGIYFWATGFGFLHILYGSILYFRYER